MKNQWKWIIILAALALLLGGAYVLYERLGDSYQPGGDIVLPPNMETEGESKGEESSAESQSEEVTETAGENESESKSETENDPHAVPAPAITFYTYEGTPLTLSEFIGKPVILNFWASWCPPCKAEMPDFEKTFREFGDEVHFVMINVTDNVRETRKSAHSFIESMGYTFPVYYDNGNQAYYKFIAYTGGSLPATFFIDSKGNLKGYYVGQLPPAVMEQGLEAIR